MPVSTIHPPFRDYEFDYSFITFFFAVQAATTEWLGDMPNPLEIGGQIEDCLLLAQEAGLRKVALGNSLQKTGTKIVKAKNCPIRCLLVSDGNKKSLLIKIKFCLIFYYSASSVMLLVT